MDCSGTISSGCNNRNNKMSKFIHPNITNLNFHKDEEKLSGDFTTFWESLSRDDKVLCKKVLEGMRNSKASDGEDDIKK